MNAAYYAYDYEAGALDPDGDEISSQKQTAKTFVNFSAKYKAGSWYIDLGITDLLNEVRKFPQPYNDSSTPYTGVGRTVFLSFTYEWPF